MYPQRELNCLAAHKAALRAKITRRRDTISRAALDAVQPLVWADRLLRWWRQTPPLLRLTVVPLLYILSRTLFPRHRTLGRLLRWGPSVLSKLRHFMLAHVHTA